VARDITSLPIVVPAPEGKPVRPEAEANQKLVASILLDPDVWTPELADFTSQVFDALSETWVDDRSSYRPAPLLDALARGDIGNSQRCLEIGSGTGVLTSYLVDRWRDVVCVDISMGMMGLNRHKSQVQADARALPFPDASFDTIALGDAPLFVKETLRVMAHDGTLIWCNALGTGAPYYLPVDDLFDALVAAAPGSRWSASTSEALWGSWAVFRRGDPCSS
jgi:SAM-dependent methyltransferase